MGLKRGFDDKVQLYTAANTKVTLATVGDITYGSSKTDIPVKTRASNKVRTIPGMESCPITITVLAGTDPADPNSVNGYALLQNAYERGIPVKMEFGESGDSLSDTFSILSFEKGAPLDDLKTANVTLAPSALTISGYPTASGTPSGTGGEPGDTGGDGGEEGGETGGEDNGEHNGDIQTEGNP